jgi:2-dehydro-3-deoxyphosphogluconate aldolase/(4S)-4-hydroxy-2-oxoglutarate aldolase
VIKLNDAGDAVALCGALKRGGLPVAEITFRTSAAEESIRRVAESLPDVMLGAGTVLSIDQAKRAVAAGAKYIVSPGFNPGVVGWCIEQDVPILPGCSSPTDIEAALEFGLKAVKFFPAESIGGLPAIKAMSAPYGDVRFVPTGGINEKNLTEYLAFPKILACGGSWMVKDELVAAKDWDAIAELTRSAVSKMLGFDLAHIGINAEDGGEALLAAQAFSGMFGWAVKDGNSSAFAGPYIEMMKGAGRGSRGHIAVGVNSVLRAQSYLEGLGVKFLEAAPGAKAVYLQDEIAGFAIHLLQKS